MRFLEGDERAALINLRQGKAIKKRVSVETRHTSVLSTQGTESPRCYAPLR